MAETQPASRCLLCGGADLTAADGFETLPRVTSDCRPWGPGGVLLVCDGCRAVQKPVTAANRDELSQIYEHYAIHPNAGGAEQTVFTPSGQGRPRSAVLAEWVLRQGALPAGGRLIDIGCGNGATLSLFGAALGDWDLYGYELDARSSGRLDTIHRFQALHTGALSDISGRFDLITAIHSLEHMVAPGTVLRDLRTLATSNAHLLVQVPNLLASPFDILIADHVMHFTPAQLVRLATNTGWQVLELRDDLVSKEISLLCVAAEPGHLQTCADSLQDIVAERITWLRTLLTLSRRAARQAVADGKSVGVFGTANAAAWLSAVLDGAVDFYLDEDRNRIGGHFAGRPVLAPKNCPDRSVVIFPLSRGVAEGIARRHANLRTSAVLPPAEGRPTHSQQLL